MQDREKLYGQVIVDFANAKNLNDAYFKLRENIQLAFGFSERIKEFNPACDLETPPQFRNDRTLFEALKSECHRQLKEMELICEYLGKAVAEIVDGKRLDHKASKWEMGTAELLLIFFNRNCRPQWQITAEDTIIQRQPFSEEDFFPKYREDAPGVPEIRASLAFFYALVYCFVEFIRSDKNNRKLIRKCLECKKYYISKTIRPSKFCSDNCRLAWHNRKRIKSGEAAKYKRMKRIEGAKESYYG